MMILVILKLLLGLLLILIGANFLIDGSTSIARKLGLSEFVVGLTIVGIGTSTPEMVVSFISAIQGKADLAVGNVVGSNIANILLILGTVAVIAPIALTRDNVKKDIPLLIISTLLLVFIGNDSFFGRPTNIISRLDGFILLGCFILFLLYSFTQNKEEAPENSGSSIKMLNPWLSALCILGGLAGLIFGGDLFVNSGSVIATHLGASDAFIGITIMAIGTSLPELAASSVAAIKKSSQMALGNVVGSNIANIFLILGGSAIINPLTMKDITIVDITLLISSTMLILLSAISFKKRLISRKEGGVFVCLYFIYISWMIYNL